MLSSTGRCAARAIERAGAARPRSCLLWATSRSRRCCAAQASGSSSSSSSAVGPSQGVEDEGFDARHYRRNVGVCVVDRRTGLVFAAQRSDSSCQTWQMPQGGVDEGEAPEQAALRELEEETCIRTARVVGEIDKYLIYEFPTTVRARLHGGWEKFRGQAQRWFLVLFEGEDSEINIDTAHKEFKSWRWMPLAELPASVVEFKREVYEEVAEAFIPKIAELQRQGVVGVAVVPAGGEQR